MGQAVTAMLDPKIRFADIPSFSDAAQDDLTGANAEFLAAVTLAYFQPHRTAPTTGSGGHQEWRVRESICLVVDSATGEVVRVTERELSDDDDPITPLLGAVAAKPRGPRVRTKGGHNLPTDSVEFLARCKAAGLVVEETPQGNHWKITDPSGRHGGNMVHISSTTNLSEIRESVGHVKRRLGVDVRKWTRTGPTGEHAARRRKLPAPHTAFAKTIIEGGPTRSEVRASNRWVKDPEPTPDEEVAAMLATAEPEAITNGAEPVASAEPAASVKSVEPVEPTEPAASVESAEPVDELAEMLGLARLAVISKTMSAFEKNTPIMRYVKMARSAGLKDRQIAGKIGVTPNALGARMSIARRDGHPEAPPVIKKFTDPRSGRVSKPGDVDRTRVVAEPVTDGHKSPKTRPETTGALEKLLAEHGEPEPTAEPSAVNDDLTAQVAPDAPLFEGAEPVDTTEETPVEDDGSSVGSLRELGEARLSEIEAALVAGEVEEAEEVEAEPSRTYVVGGREMTEAEFTATYRSREGTGEFVGLAPPREPEWVGVVADRHAQAEEILVEMRRMRDDLEALQAFQGVSVDVPTSPADALLGALRAVGVEIDAAQFRQARLVLADAGWTLRLDGRVS